MEEDQHIQLPGHFTMEGFRYVYRRWMGGSDSDSNDYNVDDDDGGNRNSESESDDDNHYV